MADDHEERLRQHEEILRSLTAMLAAQHAMNQRMAAMLTNHDRLLHQQVEINQDVKTTLARVETLLARLLQTDTNGQNA